MSDIVPLNTKLIPFIVSQLSQPNVSLRLREPISQAFSPSNSQLSPKLLHLFLSMKSPELPATLCSAERLNHLLSSGMLREEVCTVVDDIVYHDH